jgi:hypothetical protein
MSNQRPGESPEDNSDDDRPTKRLRSDRLSRAEKAREDFNARIDELASRSGRREQTNEIIKNSYQSPAPGTTRYVASWARQFRDFLCRNYDVE